MAAMHEYPLLCAMGDRCRPADQGGPRRTDRAWVCRGCGDTMTAGFHTIASTWTDVEDALVSPPASGGERGRQRHGAIHAAMPYNPAAASARRLATGHVWFAARTLRECRPTLAMPDVANIPSLADWIATWHIPALMATPGRYTTMTLVSDTGYIARRMRDAAFPSPRTRWAPTGIACDEDGCAGHYVVLVGGGLTPDLICDADTRHTVAPSVWQRHSWVRTHRPLDLTRIVGVFLDGRRAT